MEVELKLCIDDTAKLTREFVGSGQALATALPPLVYKPALPYYPHFLAKMESMHLRMVSALKKQRY